jgi:hypothetical protein
MEMKWLVRTAKGRTRLLGRPDMELILNDPRFMPELHVSGLFTPCYHHDTYLILGEYQSRPGKGN